MDREKNKKFYELLTDMRRSYRRIGLFEAAEYLDRVLKKYGAKADDFNEDADYSVAFDDIIAEYTESENAAKAADLEDEGKHFESARVALEILAEVRELS